MSNQFHPPLPNQPPPPPPDQPPPLQFQPVPETAPPQPSILSEAGVNQLPSVGYDVSMAQQNAQFTPQPSYQPMAYVPAYQPYGPNFQPNWPPPYEQQQSYTDSYQSAPYHYDPNQSPYPGYAVPTQADQSFAYQQMNSYNEQSQMNSYNEQSQANNYYGYQNPGAQGQYQYEQLNPEVEEGEWEEPSAPQAIEGELETQDVEDDDWHFCSLCKVPFEDELAYNRHSRGINHIQKLLAGEIQAGRIEPDPDPPKEDQIDLEALRKKAADPNKRDILPNEIGGATFDKRWFCADCNCSCSGEEAFKAHLQGKRHAKTLKMKTSIGMKVVLPSSSIQSTHLLPNPAIQGMLATDAIDTNEKAEIQPRLDAIKEPLIGLKYVVEYVSSFNPPRYVCNLCEAKCDSNTVISHLIGFKHRLRYLKEVRCDIYAEVQLCADSKQGQSELLSARCREIEKDDGRPNITQRREVFGKSDLSAVGVKKDAGGVQQNNNPNKVLGPIMTIDGRAGKRIEEVGVVNMKEIMQNLPPPAHKADRDYRSHASKETSNRRRGRRSSSKSDESDAEDRRCRHSSRSRRSRSRDRKRRSRSRSKNRPREDNRDKSSKTRDDDDNADSGDKDKSSLEKSLATPVEKPDVLKMLLRALVTTSVKKDSPDAARLSTALTNAIVMAKQHRPSVKPPFSTNFPDQLHNTDPNFDAQNKPHYTPINRQKIDNFGGPRNHSGSSYSNSFATPPRIENEQGISAYTMVDNRPIGGERGPPVVPHRPMAGEYRPIGDEHPIGEIRRPIGGEHWPPIGETRRPMGDERRLMGDERRPMGGERWPISDKLRSIDDKRRPIVDEPHRSFDPDWGGAAPTNFLIGHRPNSLSSWAESLLVVAPSTPPKPKKLGSNYYR